MTPRDLTAHTSQGRTAVMTYFYVQQHGTKFTPLFLPADGEASWFGICKLGLLTVR